MNTTQSILLIVLAAALAIFLILAIVAVILVLRVLKAVTKLTDKAEHVLESAENVGETIKNAATPIGLIRAVTTIVSAARKRRK